MLVMARAYGGEPIIRTVVNVGPMSVYLAHPMRLNAVRRGETNPIGFPKHDVFGFDQVIYDGLLDRWRKAGSTNPSDWPEPLDSFGSRVKFLRQKKGASTREIPGISSALCSQIETGVAANPSAEKLIILADFFGVSVDWLLGRASHDSGRQNGVSAE